MRIIPLLLVLLTSPVFASQTVWKWVDADGVTHFSDRPVPGATRMEISTGSASGRVSSPAPAVSSPQAADPVDASTPYQDFEILRPGDQEMIQNTGGQVTVTVRIEPQLRPGHSISLYLNGVLVPGFSGNALSFDLTEVPRGTHRVVAVITTVGGARLQETPPVTFFVQQASIAQPPVGPSLRPPPRPQPHAGNKLPTSQPAYAALNDVPSAKIDPVTNRPVVTKPAVKTPVTAPAGKN